MGWRGIFRGVSFAVCGSRGLPRPRPIRGSPRLVAPVETDKLQNSGRRNDPKAPTSLKPGSLSDARIHQLHHGEARRRRRANVVSRPC